MKKILVVGMSDNIGGVENVIINYYRILNNKNVEFNFLINTDNIAFENEIEATKIFKIHKRSKNIFKYYLDLYNFFKHNSSNYDALWYNACDLVNIDYLIFAKKWGIKNIVIHAHTSKNMWSKIRNIIHNINKQIVQKYSNYFWACSEDAGKYFFTNRIRKSNKYLLINNAIDTNKFCFNNQIRNEYRKKLLLENCFVIGNVGRLHYGKNQSFIIDILYKLKNTIPNCKLVLVGDGEEKNNLVNKIKLLGLETNVVFLGKRNDVNNLLQCFDIFVFPSLFEGFPVSIIESQCSGLNTLISKQIDKKEYYFGNNLLAIDFNDGIDKWCEKIIELYNEKKYNREDDSKNNIKIIKSKKFDLTVQSEFLEKIIMEMS